MEIKEMIMFIIDILYSKGFKGKQETYKKVKNALNELNFNENEYFINIREIKKEKEAKLWKFAGSPTVKINSVDIEPGFKEYGFYQRYYGNDTSPDYNAIKISLRMDLRERAKIYLEPKRTKKSAKKQRILA